jgi:HAD superfamily hydrolase (TIGR01509 family)
MNVGLMTPQAGWRLILRDLHREGYDPDEIIRLWRKRDFWLRESLATVRALHTAGYRLAILTNSWLGLTDEADKSTLPDELILFEHILDSSKEGMCKPEDPFYALLEARTGAQGEDIFLIDDAMNNLPPAAARGWKTFHFSTNNSQSSNQAIQKILLA